MNQTFKVIENEFERKVAIVTGLELVMVNLLLSGSVQEELLLLLLVAESHHFMISVKELTHPENTRFP